MFYDRLLERLEDIRLRSRTPGQRIIMNRMVNGLRSSKVVLFDTEQAEVFMNSSYPFENYPHFVFPEIFINFTRPLAVAWPDIYMFDSNVWGVKNQPSGTENYQGILIRQADVNSLQPNRSLNLTDVIESKGFFGLVDEKVATVESIKGCSSSWYESLGKDGDMDCFEVTFTPQSFPDFDNREVHRLYNTLDGAETLHRLTVNLLYFLSCENVDFDYHEPQSSKEFMRRIGQRTQNPFYTIKFKRSGERTRPISTGTGKPHSYRYDVRGHFRHLRDERYERNPDGTYKVMWVPAHQRGLANELYVPALRDVTRQPRVYP